MDEAYEKHRAWCIAMGRRILVAGLCAAAAIYFLAGDNSLSLRADGGQTGQAAPENSKQYLRSMEYYGGKANVMAYELRMWFAGLFQGRNLAYTVGAAGIAAALGFFILAGFIPPGRAPSQNGQEPPENSG